MRWWRVGGVGVALWACGGHPMDLPDGGQDGALDSAGWTTCASPNGQRVCRGPNNCPIDSKSSADCPLEGCANGDNLTGMITDTLGVCVPSPGFSATYCSAAPDGKVCISVIPPDASVDWNAGTADFELGLLFLRNGTSARVRYADWGLFDGTPLPAPTTCPTLQNVRICGGNCGGCAPNETCHGRSPLHPYGFCIADVAENCDMNTPKCPNMTDDCFAFKVQVEAQAVASHHGRCVPKAACPELQTQYPGGGKCAGL